MNGNGKPEEIIVGSNEIAASTAQLVVASNVKADRDSANRKALMEAKNNVSSSTADLVATAKSFLKNIEDQSKKLLLFARPFSFYRDSFHIKLNKKIYTNISKDPNFGLVIIDI